MFSSKHNSSEKLTLSQIIRWRRLGWVLLGDMHLADRLLLQTADKIRPEGLTLKTVYDCFASVLARQAIINIIIYKDSPAYSLPAGLLRLGATERVAVALLCIEQMPIAEAARLSGQSTDCLQRGVDKALSVLSPFLPELEVPADRNFSNTVALYKEGDDYDKTSG